MHLCRSHVRQHAVSYDADRFIKGNCVEDLKNPARIALWNTLLNVHAEIS